MFGICRGPRSVWRNEQCMDIPKYFHIWALCYMNAYFITDFLVLIFLVGGKTTLDIQIYIHHVLFVISFYLTLIFNNYTVVVGVLLMFTEVSSAYLSIRWLFYTHKKEKTKIATWNTIWILIIFGFGRVLYSIVLLLGFGLPRYIKQF